MAALQVLPVITSVTSACNSPIVMTAQTMSFRYELACKGFSAEKAHDFVTLQNDICCFIGLPLRCLLNSVFFNYIYDDDAQKVNIYIGSRARVPIFGLGQMTRIAERVSSYICFVCSLLTEVESKNKVTRTWQSATQWEEN